MEFLVEFEVEVPAGTPDAEVEHHQRAESAAAAKLSQDGHLVRLWRRPLAGGGTTAIGLYRADSQAELDGLLAVLPLADCMSWSRRSRRTPTIPQRALDESPASRAFRGAGPPPRSNRRRTVPLGDIRYTLQTDDGDLLYVQSRGVRHGSADVLERLARGEDVDATEYTFRACIQIETAAPALDWLNKGVFISVGGRRPGAVIYETYLVG